MHSLIPQSARSPNPAYSPDLRPGPGGGHAARGGGPGGVPEGTKPPGTPLRGVKPCRGGSGRCEGGRTATEGLAREARKSAHNSRRQAHPHPHPAASRAAECGSSGALERHRKCPSRPGEGGGASGGRRGLRVSGGGPGLGQGLADGGPRPRGKQKYGRKDGPSLRGTGPLSVLGSPCERAHIREESGSEGRPRGQPSPPIVTTSVKAPGQPQTVP